MPVPPRKPGEDTPARGPVAEARKAPARRTGRRACGGTAGATLSELAVALALVAVAAAMAIPAFDVLDRVSLARSADLAQGHLARARLTALARRGRVEVRLGRPGQLVLQDAAGSRIADVDVAGEGLLRLDSIRVRPAVIRFNARGQGSAGSLYLYRGNRGVRVVSNFLGRTRRQRMQF